MSKRNGKRIHMNRLMRSGPGIATLASALEDKFISLNGLYFKLKAVELEVPKSLVDDVIRWRRLRIRHKQRDFRHTESEKKSVVVLAKWTLEVKAKLCNQPVPKVPWGD